MLDKIDSNDITVQVEGSKIDRVIPDGIAISKGTFDLGAQEGGSSFTEMSMTKNGDLTGLGSTWVTVTGWTASAAFPGTSIVSNALSMTTAGQARIVFKAAFGDGWWESNLKTAMRILLNGTVVKEGSSGAKGTISLTRNVVTGDKFSVQVKVNAYWFSTNFLRGTTETSLTVQVNARGRFDFQDDLMWPDKTTFISDANIKYAVPPGKKTGRKSLWRMYSEAHETGFGDNTGVSSSFDQWTGFTVGPVLTQSKVPIAVEAGMTISMSGRFVVRGTLPSGDGALKNDLDQITRGIARFSLWGKGVVQDEYGVDVVTTIELMYYEGLIGNSQSSFTMFDISGVPPATIPPGITDVVFTVSNIYQTGGEYGTLDYEFKEVNKALRVSYIGCYDEAYPLKIIPSLPSAVNKTYTHSLSRTGVAFRQRARFDNVLPGAKIAFTGYPGDYTGIYVYNWVNGARGSQILDSTSVPGQLKIDTINPVGTTSIEVVAHTGWTFFIESVQNPSGHSLTSSWNNIEQINYTNINDDISKITVLREEGDKGVATIDFCSDILDPSTSATLKPGKTIRVLGRHYGDGITKRPSDWTGEALYEVIYQGVIKRVTSKYSYDDQPIIQVTAYDATDAVERMTTGVALDEMSEYGAYFNRTGVPVLYNDFDWGGPNKTMPNRFIFKPSAYGNMSLADSLSMTRNTHKQYWIVDKYNRIVIMNSLSPTNVLTLTDGTLPGDISYGQISKGSDTDTVINKIMVNEYLLDRKDYVEKQLGGGDEPPLDFDYILSKQQTATFQNIDSINAYGEFEKTFDCVRGNGEPLDLFYGKIGESFSTWAQAILNEKSEPTMDVSDILVPVKSSDQIRILSELELLDRVTVVYKGEAKETRIREIEHTIVPGKWFTEIRFVSKGDMTYWS